MNLPQTEQAKDSLARDKTGNRQHEEVDLELINSHTQIRYAQLPTYTP